MSFTAGSVMDLAASAMNDTAKTLYTYVVQLPYLKMAQGELESELLLAGIALQLKSSAVIDVAAGITTLPLPADFFLPISLYERKDGSTNDDEFVEITERTPLPDTEPALDLNYYEFKNNAINFIGATEAKDVKLTYWATIPEIANEASNLALERFKMALAYRTAGLMARLIGRNDGRADFLDGFAGNELEKGIAIYTKNQQGKRVRRKPFNGRR